MCLCHRNNWLYPGTNFSVFPQKGTVFTLRTVFTADTGVNISQQCGQRITVFKPVQKIKNLVKVVDCLRSVVTDKPVDTQRNGVDSLLQGCIGGNAGGFLRLRFPYPGNQFQVSFKKPRTAATIWLVTLSASSAVSMTIIRSSIYSCVAI